MSNRVSDPDGIGIGASDAVGEGFDVAIVGMAGRFPGARNLEEYWRNLANGVESIASLSDEELTAAGVDPQTLADPAYVKVAPVLEGIELFDAALFGYSPREAAILDPQHRLFLTTAWEALEAAGYNSETDGAAVGVFAGASLPHYLISNLLAGRRLLASGAAFEALIGNDKDYLATRTSFKLNLRGPSITVQTACSTSLVAVHLACQSLLSCQCDMALAGGVALRVPQAVGYFCQDDMIFSPDGCCRAFDARGRGTIFGSGVGVVVLKRLEDALADGDQVEAVIKGSAVNNDGSVKIGYTAPSAASQAEVVATALAVADADPRTITAIEAHGTGTQLGDPIEIAALNQVFRESTDDRGFCAIGSVKSNFGHLESAAGVAGLIKVVLALKHGKLPPSLHFEEPNPQIDFATSPFYVNTELRDWQADGNPRRAGVSSFGIGGTNAHAVVEEAPEVPPSEPGKSWQLLIWSARSESALATMTGNLTDYLKDQPEVDLADVAHTLQVGRWTLPHRRVLVCRDPQDALSALDPLDPERVFGSFQPSQDRPVAFMFSGQGSQYPDMGRELYELEPVYREHVDACCRLLEPHLDFDLRQVLYPPAEAAVEAAERLAQTAVTQPALFVTEYALGRLLMAWGIAPQAMIGHSIGEYVAACFAEVLSLADALALVAKRGQLMNELPGGAMLSVPLPAAEIEPLLGDDHALAAINGPALCVVSGPHSAISELADRLAEREVKCRRLHTSHAFHSSMMEPILEPFTEVVKQVELKPPTIPFISNVTGTWITPEEATDASYWARHLRHAVRFADGVAELGKEPDRSLLEVGPGRSLTTLARRSLPRDAVTVVCSSMRHPEDEGSDLAFLLGALGRLWLGGASVDWRALYSEARRRRVALPTYPFQERRYWVEAQPSGGALQELEISVGGGEAEDADADARGHLQTVYVAPRNDLERTIATIWQKKLGLQRVGIYDSFFELGGHSLLATQVQAEISRLHQVRIPLRKLFVRPVVAGLAAVVAELTGTAAEPSVAVEAPVVAELPAVVANPEERYQPFPLTDMQQAQWIGRNTAFNMGNVAAHVYLENDSDNLDLERLEETLRQVIARHEMLRAIVLPDGRQQILAEVPPYEIERLDLRACDPPEAERRLLALRQRMSHQVRPADKWPLFEVRASQLPDGRLRMHLSLDLVICDIASLRILLAEWSQLYHHPEQSLPVLELSFRDYVLTEQKIRDTDLYRQALDYWRQRIPSLPPAPQLPLARDPAEIDRPHFSRWSHRLDHDTWQRVKNRAAQAGLSASGVVLTAFAKLLSTWSRSPRFCVNSTIINRLPMHPQVTELIGEFASFAPTEVNDSPGKTFLELAQELQGRSWQDLENRYVSGVRILREIVRLAGRVEGATMPVVLTSTLIHGSAAEEEGLTDWLGEPAHAISQTPQVWLDHSVFEDKAGLLMSWHAADGLFPDRLLDDMWEVYVQLYYRLADDERTWQRSALDLVPAAQLAARRELNATEAPLGDELLHTLFAAQAAQRPEQLAVLAPDRRLTYGELEHGSNRLGRRLRALEVQPNELVPVVMEKGWEQIPAVLAVLKAGGAYLGIEADTPEERLRYMLENSGARVLLTQPALRETVDWPPGIEVLAVDDGVLAEGDGGPLESVQGPDDLAYVIYTSGSTGWPKGVMINHRGAVNTILDVNRRFSVGTADRVLALSSLAFDLSVYDVFGLLAAGGTVVLPRAGSQRDPAHWLQLVVSENVTVWNSVPALMEIFAEYTSRRPEVPPLRLALLSGDWIPVTLPGRIRKLVEGVEVISLGGATEASIWSILYPVGEVDRVWDSIPYGRPMVNQRFHVLNEALQPCPVWVPGELYIGGVGLAQGYWQDEEKTRASFFHHPDTGERLYRTGDLGRYLPDGDIEFLGREDFQVKVLGHRIELGEIEACLVQHPAVRAAAVQALGDQRGSKRLAAYVVPETTEPTDGAEEVDLALAPLRAFLGERLPEYMVPPDFVVLAELPLTANGKVDRRALPEPRRGGGESGEVAVVEGPVAELVEIFSQVLGSDQIGVHDNFFELGGDSILGIQLVNLANESGLHITPQHLFEHQTIAELAPVAAAASQLAEQGLVTGPAPLTPFERRFLAAHPESEDSSQWLLLELAEDIDPVLLGRAVQQLITHHDALRLRLERSHDGWQQRNATDDQAVHLARRMLPATEDREQALERFARELESGLDLARGPLVAGAVIEPEGDGPRLFLFLAHRLAVDTRSWQLMLADLETAYAQLSRGEALEMPPKTVSFKHWGHALEEHARSSELQGEVDYWLAATGTRTGHLELGSGGADLGGPLHTVSVCLEEDASRTLFGDALAAYNLAPEELILTALVEVFTERVEAPLRIEFEQSGRNAELDKLDLSRTVGRFTVLYPVLLQIAGIRDPGERLKAVKEQVRGVPDHGLGHGVLHYLSPDPEVLDQLAGQQVPELRFSYLGHLDRLLPDGSRLGTLHDVRTLALDPLAGHGHLLSVSAYALGDRLILDWTFPERDGNHAVVERLAAAFLDAAKALIAHCLSPEAGGFTPSDFPEAGIDQSELDTFMSLFAGSDTG